MPPLSPLISHVKRSPFFITITSWRFWAKRGREKKRVELRIMLRIFMGASASVPFLTSGIQAHIAYKPFGANVYRGDCVRYPDRTRSSSMESKSRKACSSELFCDGDIRWNQHFLESPSNPEKEPCMTIITDGTCDLDRSEYGVHDQTGGNVHWQIWRLGAKRKLVCLPQL